MAPTAAASAQNVTFAPNDGEVISTWAAAIPPLVNLVGVDTSDAANYAGPGPAAGEGPHRYAWLLFAQPAAFHAPAGLNAPNSAPGHWNVTSYVGTSGLGNLVAASFFTVENGQASYAVPSTSSYAAANSGASASGAGATTSGASGSGSGSSPASATASSTSTKSAASGPVMVPVVMTAFVGLFMAIAMRLA